MTTEGSPRHVTFSPGLASADASANYWMHQVTVRLRRDVCWRWQERTGAPAPSATALPPVGDRLVESLDLGRYWDAMRAFFETDTTARYLSEQLRAAPPTPEAAPPRGSFRWVVETLRLDAVSTFALALGLTACFDNAVGPVIAACLNDPGKTQPTLGLTQKLWDQPEDVLSLADPAQPVWRYGVLQAPAAIGQPGAAIDWESPIAVAPLVAQQLLFPDTPLPQVLAPLDIAGGGGGLQISAHLLIDRLKSAPAAPLRIVPVRGRTGAAYAETVRTVAAATGKDVRGLRLEAALLDNPAALKALFTLAWLKGVDLFLHDDPGSPAPGDRPRPYSALSALRAVPITVFLGISEPGELAPIARDLLLPMLEVPRLSYTDRVAYWHRALGRKSRGLEQAIAECARRFRYEQGTIGAICAGLQARLGRLAAADLVAACRSEVPLDVGELAQQVTPRFAAHELILPQAQQLQFEEIFQAMRALTEVHYGWGTGTVWNESGISVLFAGPPGTGKTMAAEILAVRLDMPMYRIDLSQVVNKYIGETEKNLKRLFDVADMADTILFFDEADALFGRRTEVRDAHDRYANLEVSYLLERMERFKGLAILATNRRKDLDEAFLRRLRYILEFPLPDVPQRKAIWQRVIPPQVDASGLDFDFLARQFQLAGGHIRSIVFNACLQTAEGTWPGTNGIRPQLSMERIIVAVKREYDKLKRSVSLEQFGRYAGIVEGLEHE